MAADSACSFRPPLTLPLLIAPDPRSRSLPSARILLIDDDDSLASLLADSLRREGYDPRLCGDVAHAKEELRNDVFDVILLDVMLPDRSGFEFCAELRNQGVEIPVLMLTARGDVMDRVAGLRIGADDYLSKPFEVPELLARIEALRRRASQNSRSDSGLFEFGDVRVNLYQRSVSRSGQSHL
jgi:DNA-binding response OmpR family regulator